MDFKLDAHCIFGFLSIIVVFTYMENPLISIVIDCGPRTLPLFGSTVGFHTWAGSSRETHLHVGFPPVEADFP